MREGVGRKSWLFDKVGLENWFKNQDIFYRIVNKMVFMITFSFLNQLL